LHHDALTFQRGYATGLHDACQDDALRLCHDEAMSQDDARISKCMKAHKAMVGGIRRRNTKRSEKV
jgi:hypothetical protein